MKILTALILAIAMAACASFQSSTPAQKVFAASLAYDTAQSVALAYKSLPPCDGNATVLCADPSVIVTIKKADNVAFEALASAQKVVRESNQSATALDTAVRWAQESITAFVNITNALKTK